jgi:hypothetical protein
MACKSSLNKIFVKITIFKKQMAGKSILLPQWFAVHQLCQTLARLLNAERLLVSLAKFLNSNAAIGNTTYSSPAGPPKISLILTDLLVPLVKNGLSKSIGTGKMVVELFSVAISLNVCR